MFHRSLLAAVFLVLRWTIASAQTSSGTAGLSGTWEGQLLLGTNWRFLEARFGTAGDNSGARVDLPQDRREFRDFTVSGTRLRWTLARGQDQIRFDGALVGDVIRGTVEQNQLRGEFQLVRTSRTGGSRELDLTGTYRTSQGDLISVARYDFGDGVDRLALMETRAGLWGALLPVGADRYTVAPARSGRFPTLLRAAFTRGAGGLGSTVSVTGADSAAIVGRRVTSYHARDISFANSGVTLAGEVISPDSSGPHAVIVMVHSSGNQSRNGPVAYFRLIANLLAANGITTLVYDKRGVAQSTGDWRTATYRDLAEDVRAAIAAVRRLANVDPQRVGLWGLSQAGWVAPLAAEGSDVAFLALISTAAVTPAQQEIDRVAAVMRANRASQEDIESAARYLRTFFEVVARRQPWDQLRAAMAETAGASWLRYVPRPQTERDVGWQPEPSTLDPAPLLSSLRAPVLAIHGGNDVDVSPSLNSALYSRVSTHPESRQRVFDRADHFLLEEIDDPDREYRRLSPGFLKLMIDWLLRVSR